MLGPELQDLLVEAGLFDRAELQRHSRVLGEGQRLADVLVVLPSKLALEHLALPIAWDAVHKSLTLVLADPKALTPLEDVPAVARAQSVVALVALPGVIEAAVQRLYGLGPKAPAPAAQAASACPQCHSSVEEDQLECGQCGLLLNPDAPDRSDGSIVRALLAEPSRVARAPSRDRAHDAPTRQGFPIAVTEESVPQICGSVDILRRLTDFEAYLLSLVDGALDVAGLSAASGLMGVEVRSMVASLAERGVLELGALDELSASELVTAPEGMEAVPPPLPKAPAPAAPSPGPGAIAPRPALQPPGDRAAQPAQGRPARAGAAPQGDRARAREPGVPAEPAQGPRARQPVTASVPALCCPRPGGLGPCSRCRTPGYSCRIASTGVSRAARAAG